MKTLLGVCSLMFQEGAEHVNSTWNMLPGLSRLNYSTIYGRFPARKRYISCLPGQAELQGGRLTPVHELGAPAGGRASH